MVSPKYQELLSDGTFIFHNPMAKNKLQLEAFEDTNITQIFIESSRLKYTSNTYPIVARLNIPKFFSSSIKPQIMENLRLYNKKDMIEFYNIN